MTQPPPLPPIITPEFQRERTSAVSAAKFSLWAPVLTVPINPVQSFQWDGWTHLPTIQLQSPIVPFSSILSENPFGMSGPLRSVYQNYDFQLNVPPTPSNP